jgi:hypothetical protein
MTRRITIHLAALRVGAMTMVGCDRQTPLEPHDSPVAAAPLAGRGATQTLSPALCALSRRDFTLKSTNDHFPLDIGSTWTLRGEEDGKRVELRIRILRKTELVGGVTTRIIEERHFEDGELVEHSRNFFAATKEGTACYLGEEVDIYEDGQIVSHDGSWRADDPDSAPGIFVPADPRVGMKYLMESAPSVAEDAAEIVSTGRVRVPAGTFRKSFRIRETNPLDGSVGFKVFARGVGIVVDEPLQLVRYRIAGDDDRDSD